jgi:hypothetical protein
MNSLRQCKFLADLVVELEKRFDSAPFGCLDYTWFAGVGEKEFDRDLLGTRLKVIEEIIVPAWSVRQDYLMIVQDLNNFTENYYLLVVNEFSTRMSCIAGIKIDFL